MNFVFPWAGLLFLPWIALCIWVMRRRRDRGVLFASAATIQRPKFSWRYALCRVLPAIFLLGIAILIIAAAGPRKCLSREVISEDALAIMMVADVSGSMCGLDLSEGTTEKDRLTVVKEQFRRFVEARPYDLIGLVTFGGYASVRSPLTADHAALLHTLSGVQIPGIDNGLDERGRPVTDDETMTAIGDGLSVGLLRLMDAEPKTRIVILLSDGENNAGVVTPMEAAKMAKSLGIRVYTIGVGTTGLTKVRMRQRNGQSVLVDMQMRLDEDTLKGIAEMTGGQYANVRSSTQLDAALASISQLETTRVERQIFTRYRPLTQPFVIAGVLILLLATGGLTCFLHRPI